MNHVAMQWRSGVITLAVAVVAGVTALTPLTDVELTATEGEAFVATLQGALDKLAPATRVVHILGASKVEDAVDWSPLCASTPAPTLVLVGPQVVERPVRDCVYTVKGLYSRDTVLRALGPALATPDAVMLHNADLYTCPWRRTLAEVTAAAFELLPAAGKSGCECR